MPLTKITTDNIDFSSNLVFSNVTSMNVTTLNAGDALITGNLTVTGTTVTVNTNILDVKDLNITVAKGAGSSALSNGAGLTVDFPNAQFFYTSSDDSWNINKAFKTTNNVTIGTSAYFVANGNVGIGTSSPSQKLEVNGIVKATSFEGGGAIPSGTSMLFVQTTAPTGWTKSTTHDNKALRIVNGTAGSGGSVAFTSAFASQGVSGSINSVTVTGTVGATTLSTSQIPAHRHGYDGLLINNTNAFIINDGGGDNMAIADNAIDGVNGAYPKNLSIGGSGSHDHSFSGGSHSHTFTGTSINLAVQYVDAIIATKD